MANTTNNARTPKNALTPEDKMKMLIAVADLPFVRRSPKSTDYMRDVQLTVLDFHMHATAVGKAISHFSNEVQAPHGIHTHAQLAECLARFPDTPEGNAEASLFLWNNRHWKRAGYLRGLLAFLASVGVTDQAGLHEWVKTAQFERDFQGKVPGLGLAVFHWLLIRCGVSTIKPDVWVAKNFERVTGKHVADKVLVELFQELAPLVGESMVTIDKTIWSYERVGMATNDVPALRVVFWRQAHVRLQDRISADSDLKAGNWQVVLDEPHRLRYDHAGLQLTGKMPLPGDPQPRDTTVAIQQAAWHDGLGLTITLRRSGPWLDGELATARETWKAAGWVWLDEGDFAVSLDLQQTTLMSPNCDLEGLLARVEAIVTRTLSVMRGPDLTPVDPSELPPAVKPILTERS